MCGYEILAVNESTKPLAPEEALSMLGRALPRIIAAVAEAKEADGPIFFSKYDIKDGFWIMCSEEGAEWNFAYVLPAEEDDEVEIFVPTSLQMGWTLSPAYFCVGSETGRDVAQALVAKTFGALPEHRLEKKAFHQDGKMILTDIAAWKEADEDFFLFMFETFIDDYIALAQTTKVENLMHLTRSVMHGIHSVFPPDTVTNDGMGEPISEKKLYKEEGLWQYRKEILGWLFDGASRCIKLPQDKQDKIDKILKDMLRKGRHGKILFKDFEKIVGKLRHASIGIPAG